MIPSKFYVASTLANAKMADRLIRDLEKITDMWCTYNWPTVHMGLENRVAFTTEEEEKAFLKEVAESEINAVINCQVFIMFLPGRIGSHVELGAALAQGKPIILIGDAKYKKDDRGYDIFLLCNGVIDITVEGCDASMLNENEDNRLRHYADLLIDLYEKLNQL